jgi:3-dehydrosphinganine reductase
MLYGIDTHIFFPPTMYTPGFEEENKTKPAITRAIESTDEGLTADQAAAGLLAGTSRETTTATSTLTFDLSRGRERSRTHHR